MKTAIRILYLTFLGILMISFFQCANIVPPKGGPKDETPPVLDTANSTPNFQTNYTKSPIIRTYDEWIQLKDAITQVVVSPPLDYPLEVKLRKKSVVVNFHPEEVLKENTTYTINFGDAVQDYTEGNVPTESRYVFSTGDVIDSLTFRARVIDIETKEPIEEALLMLYVNLSDTVLYKSKPYYFAKTDTGGVALIQNIRSDTFKVVALTDNNLNYQFDGESEMLHYLLDPVVVNENTDLGTLEMYIPELELNRRSIRNSYGKTTVIFNRDPYDLEYEVIRSPPIFDLVETEGDSLMLWYQDTSAMTWSVVLQNDTSNLDSVSINQKAFELTPTKGMFDAKTKSKAITFHSDTTLTYRWNRPITSIDETRMILAEDSLSNTIPVSYIIDAEDPYLIKADANWEHPNEYMWQMNEGAVTDILGATNDSIGLVKVTAKDDKAYGAVTINFSGMQPKENYLVELINTRRKTVVKNASFEIADQDEALLNPQDSLIDTGAAEPNTSVYSIDFTLLEPGNYTIRLIVDDNNNGRWDSGNYKEGRLPERLYIQEMPPLKSNWEQSIDFKL